MLACVSVEAGPEDREHIWIRVSHATTSSLTGEVASDAGSGQHQAGDSFSLDDLDWLVDWHSPDDDSVSRGGS